MTGSAPNVQPDCPGCSVRVRLGEEELERLLARHGVADSDRVAPDLYAHRLEICSSCDSLLYGSTCRHCGCLVAARAWIANQTCPRPGEARW
jgi:hypothetical protein